MIEPERVQQNFEAETLSNLTSNDLDRLVELWTAGFLDEEPEAIRWHTPQIVAAEKSELAVIRNSLGHVASAMVVTVAPGRNKRRGHIDDVATHPDSLRQGYAGRLLDFSICWFREQGVARIYLSSSDERKAAHALYLSRGFSVHNTTDFQLDLI